MFPDDPNTTPSSQAGQKSGRRPSAPKLPTPTSPATTSNRGIKAKPDSAQAAPSRIAVSMERLQKRPHAQTQHWAKALDLDQTLDLDRDLTPTWKPSLDQTVWPTCAKRPVAGHALRWLTAHVFQQPGLARYPRSAQLTSSQPCSSASFFQDPLIGPCRDTN